MLDKAGSNQRELAQVIGVCYTSIQNKVCYKRDFLVSEVIKIKNFYNL